jgi:hypothetical protein
MRSLVSSFSTSI